MELARRGFPVTSYDLSEHLLGAAKQAAKESGVDVKWVHGDIRDLPFESEFDVVINMFTAFGYFESEVENREVLRQVVRALKPGGRFVIDMANRDFSLSNFQARTWGESEDHILLEEHGFDLLRSRDLAKRIFIDKRAGYARRESTWSLRLYSAHELREMIEAAGLKVAATYGALAPDVQLSAKSPRLVMVAERGYGRNPE